MTTPTPANPALLMARAILAAADEVEIAETKIKREIIAFARAGDNARIVEIVEAWLTRPPGEVLAARST